MGLLAGNARVQGSVRFEGAEILGVPPALNRMRGSKLTMIFQDPMTSLTPHLKSARSWPKSGDPHAGRRGARRARGAADVGARPHAGGRSAG
jgi:ABC-type microcin C transport system duplicated ATPase subunit YejF